MTTATKKTFRDAVGAMNRQQRDARRRYLEELERDPTMEDLFTCKDCGSHRLWVVHTWSEDHEYEQEVACTCGQVEDGTAATLASTDRISYEERADLDEEHRWEVDGGPEQIDRDAGRESDLEVFCEECHEDAGEHDWEFVNNDDASERDQIDEEWSVCCGGCRREIEFGWSHPDRGGRIWPAECGDFNPWKSWPEPRYLESWRAKGWLRPALTT